MVSENREAAAGLRNSRAITTPSGMAHHGSVTSGTGTLVLNKKSTPCIRALKSERTKAIYEEGLMAPDALKGIRDVYFHGNMEAAPALGGQSAGLIGEVKPARAIIEETVVQFFAITSRLGGLATAQSFG